MILAIIIVLFCALLLMGFSLVIMWLVGSALGRWGVR